MTSRPTGTVTFLFTDIENSTNLAREHLESWEAALERHHAILRESVERNNGFVFRVIGDASCAAFHKAMDAIKAAVDAQRDLQAEPWGKVTIHVRMGIHTGEAELHDHEYRGYITLSFAQRLMSAGHGGQILVSNTTETLLRDQLPEQISLRDMGMQKFPGVSSPVRVFQAITPDLPTKFRPLRTVDNIPNNLPARLASFVGREQEIGILRRLLHRPDVRLVTITGPGGVGKTSLALQIAHDIGGAFQDGIFFISLAPIRDPTLMIPTIAHFLGVTGSPDRLLLEDLKDFLRTKQALLLLDNLEQIISAAPLLMELLEVCVGLRMLVTSREALRLRGEHEFPLSSLGLPDQPSLAIMSESPSITLFVQRVQEIQPDFRLTEDNASAIAEICARLDGLPLAIELAAARIKLLPPKTMLSRLQKSSLQLLTSGARDLPTRQQTLRNTIQWSYDLLNADEQRVFRRLSIFVGGSTLEAALAVLELPTSLDILDSLVSKSLLRQIESDGTSRLIMLETIREFGLEQLSSAHETDSAQRAHASYYLLFAEEAEKGLMGAEQKKWLLRLDSEQDNLRAALRWAIEHHEVDTAQRMTGALPSFWLIGGHWSEGRRWLEESLAMDSSTAAVRDRSIRAKALYGAGMLARFQGDFMRARTLCEESLASYRALADKTGILKALAQLSRISALQDDQTARDTFLAQAASLIEAVPDSVVKANAYLDMVIASVGFGTSQSPPESAHYLAESERIHRKLNSLSGLALAALHIGNRAFFEGDFRVAASRFDEAERLAMELGDIRLLNRTAVNRALLDLYEGDFATARCRLEKAFQQYSSMGDHLLPGQLIVLATILHRQGLDVWSARVMGMADVSSGARPSNASVAAYERRLQVGDTRAEVRAQLGNEVFAREIEAGHRLRLEDLLAIPHPQEPAPTHPSRSLAPGQALTAREIEVLHLLAEELSNPQIAERLVVSRRTVDAHLRSIYEKLGVKSRDAAIRVAREQGLISNL